MMQESERHLSQNQQDDDDSDDLMSGVEAFRLSFPKRRLASRPIKTHRQDNPVSKENTGTLWLSLIMTQVEPEEAGLTGNCTLCRQHMELLGD